MIGKWLERRRARAAAEEAERDSTIRSRYEWRQRERRDNDARALAAMREAFEPLTEEERREITMRVAMDTKLRGNSDGTYSEDASRYGDCAYMANNLVRMREALKS